MTKCMQIPSWHGLANNSDGIVDFLLQEREVTFTFAPGTDVLFNKYSMEPFLPCVGCNFYTLKRTHETDNYFFRLYLFTGICFFFLHIAA